MQMVLFDLDGTLLPMDQDRFTTGYFKFLAQKTVFSEFQNLTKIRNNYFSIFVHIVH